MSKTKKQTIANARLTPEKEAGLVNALTDMAMISHYVIVYSPDSLNRFSIIDPQKPPLAVALLSAKWIRPNWLTAFIGDDGVFATARICGELSGSDITETIIENGSQVAMDEDSWASFYDALSTALKGNHKC